METLSVLGKFKPEIYSLEVLPEWIQFSIGTEEFQLLDNCVAEQVVEEEKPIYIISLFKRFGINPAEIDSVKEVADGYKVAAREFFEYLDMVSEKAGLTRVEILLKIPEDLENIQQDLETQLEEAKDEKKGLLEIREEITRVKEKALEESKSIAEKIAPFQERLKELAESHDNAQVEYYKALLVHFLNRSRVVDLKLFEKGNSILDCLISNSFTGDNIDRLHIGFQRALYDFLKKEIGGWTNKEGKG
jgi:hypothetical protein